MSGGKLLYLPPWVQLQKQKLGKHYALVQRNRPLAIRIFIAAATARIVVIVGHKHSEMGKRSSIFENEKAVAGIAELLSSDSRIFYRHPGGAIDAFVSIGSALSNQLARTIDGHAETLERIRKPAFGSLLTEFDSLSKNIDAFVIKVLRSRAGAPSILRIEGLGPAATVYGFRLLLENRDILSELAQYAAKWDSFEAVIVVKNVEVKEYRLGRKSMGAAGPLETIGCWPIDGTEVDVDLLTGTYKRAPQVVPERNKIRYFPAVRERQLELGVGRDYNRDDKYAAAAVPLPGKDYVGGKEY